MTLPSDGGPVGCQACDTLVRFGHKLPARQLLGFTFGAHPPKSIDWLRSWYSIKNPVLFGF